MLDGPSQWRRNAILGVVALAPFNLSVPNEAWTGFGLRFLVIGSLVAVVAVVLSEFRASATRVDWIDATAYFWLAAIWLSALISNNVMLGGGSAARLSVAILLLPALRSVVQSRHDCTLVLRALALGAGIAVLLAIFLWLFDQETIVGEAFVGRRTFLGPLSRLTKPWAHANVAAMALGASVASVATLRKQWLVVTLATAITIGLVLTVSRGGVIAGAAVALGWVLLRRRRTDTLVVGGLVGVAVVTVLLSAAWGVRLDQLGDEAFFAANLDVPELVEAGGPSDLTSITIENQSSVTFEREGDRQVLISARWLGDDGLIWSEDWWQLPDDLAPGETLTADLSLSPRVPVGTWQIRWDLLIDQTAYFDQFLGKEPQLSRGEVSRTTVDPNNAEPYILVQRNVGISRNTGWRVAWQDFASSPLVGVGPNQFGGQAAPALAEEGQRVTAHAHNILLEPLATWGLLGTVPFAVLGAVAAWRSFQQAARTRRVEACAVAVGLLAVGVHGIFDWPLVVITTGIPVGTLMGLALSMSNVADAVDER